MANVKISQLPIGIPTSTSIFPFVDGITTYQGAISALTSNSTVEVTYSELVDNITGETLNTGSFYIITDFRTCYDQPDFDYNNNSITGDNYKQAAIEPIVVLATSANTISTTAYQPSYPNDRIQYDWTFNTTEVTSGTSYGRITERIDEFNNRTDYDHRTILFKRYRLYTYRNDQPLNGTIAINNTNLNNVTGTTTQFTNLSVGDVIYVPSMSPNYYEITNISSDTLMTITGDTLSSFGSGFDFYKTIEETNGSGYFSIRQMNVKTNDFAEYTTFGNAIDNNYAKNNYIGNYSNNYQNVGNGTFLLANNVFLEGQYESNKFGDYCYNNTFGADNQNNIWGDYCYENVSTNDIDNNIIGHYFNNNLINDNLVSNHIGNNFTNNRLLAENNQSFEYNIIGNDFNGNTIYSRFYRNEILNDFNSNTIGDFGNLTNFEFYDNVIGNSFGSNIIRKNFFRNVIGDSFINNVVNGDFYNNVIDNLFNNNNNIGYGFNNNHIGNSFISNQLIGDDFRDNKIGDDFNNNKISYNFYENQINNNFILNELGDTQYFNWNDTSIENLTGRTYDTFYESLNGNIDDVILGKELIMHDTNNDEYHIVTFTQWTQNGNGGGFQYERTKVYPTQEDTVYFTKTNYGNEVDVIVEGSIEITRGNDGGIYNQADENVWNQNESPVGTEWNSIYTQPNNGRNFYRNIIGNDFNNNNNIGNNFRNNQIGNLFNNNDNTGNNFQNNQIGNLFNNNNIYSGFYDNLIANNFSNNDIHSDFYKNEILIDFNSNTIGNSVDLSNFDFYRNYIRNGFNDNIIRQDFQNNQIGTNFQENVINGDFINNTILNGYNQNTIGNEFTANNIGNGFNNNTVYDYFNDNTIGNYFGNNLISSNFYNNNIGTNFESNEPSNVNLFGWNNLSTVSTRTYDTLRISLNNSVGNLIIGQQLVMRVISTSQYFRIKFTQWTQGGNGGGFQYERQELDSNGNTIGSLITFIKTNYGSEVDVIVEGVVELTRDSGGGLYNTITDTPPFNNAWPGPGDTEWNSIYTQLNNGENFAYNTIGNNFFDNIISNNFQYNQIGNRFETNSIGEGFGFGGNESQGNRIGNYFNNNDIGEYFYNNTISDNFYNNSIGYYFQWNVVNTNIDNINFISNYGNITGFTYTATGTTASDNIYTDLAGVTNSEFGILATFDVEVSGSTVIGVSGNTEGNLYITGNTITISGTDIGGYSNSIDTISDDGVGKNGLDGTYNDLSVTGGTGVDATFDVSVSSGLVDGVVINNRGNGYEIDDELTIIGSLFGGTDGVDDITITVTALFNDDIVITVSGVTKPSVYELYTCNIFKNSALLNRLSYYDGDDVLNIININE